MDSASDQVASDRREKLLQAAAELFVAKPYDKVTTTEIARRAGVAYGLLAHHFGNKRGVYLATVQLAADVVREVDNAPTEGLEGVAMFRAVLTRHVEFMTDNSEVLLAWVRGSIGADPDARAIIEKVQWEGAQRIFEGLEARQPLHPAVRSAVRGWLGFMDELLVDHVEHRDQSTEELVDLLVSTLHGALRVAQERAPGSIDADRLLDA
jgi:AcrR family transcriptional regulator